MRVIVAFIILIGCHLSWGQTNELGLDILQVEQEISDDVAQLFPLNLNTALRLTPSAFSRFRWLIISWPQRIPLAPASLSTLALSISKRLNSI